MHAAVGEPYRPRMSFYDITEAMLRYGGGFVRQLAITARAADDTNRRKLVLCFQDYWRQYDELAASPPVAVERRPEVGMDKKNEKNLAREDGVPVLRAWGSTAPTD